VNADSHASHRILVVDDDRALRHSVASLLKTGGHAVVQASDGPAALAELERDHFNLMILDIGLPGMSGLDLLERLQTMPEPPLVVVITADDTPSTLLAAVRGQAYRYVTKPVPPASIVAIAEEALSAGAGALPIQVLSARPEWVELVAPCVLEVADRLQAFVMQLETDLVEEVRESVGQAFRELLLNAIEWGGKLDASRTVRISCIRGKRMLLYRIVDPGDGFDIESLTHAAICNSADDPLGHALVREAKGLRPGGLGLAMTRALVDELIYNEARNEVVFIKYLD
jgi:CheY-like chemotaxis protein